MVRLPRDWLGPREELVPIGRPASIGAPAPSGDDGLPPTAEAFWSEDSAALHNAVQGPTSGTAASSTVPALPEGRGLLHPRVRWPRRPVVQARWLLAALPVLALLVLAAIGGTETPSARRAGHAPALTQAGAAAKLAAAGTHHDAQSAAPSQVKATPANTRHRNRTSIARPRGHRSGRRSSRHSKARPHTSRSTPTDVSTHTAVSTGASSTGSPANSVNVTISTTTSAPPVAPAGPTGSGALLGSGKCSC